MHYHKKYAPSEDTRRFELFKNKLEQIQWHNERFKNGEVPFKIGLDERSDWTREELVHALS
jgi:hypothetical protein